MVCWTIPALYVAAEDHWLTTNPTEPPAVFAEKYHGWSCFANIILTMQYPCQRNLSQDIFSHKALFIFK